MRVINSDMLSQVSGAGFFEDFGFANFEDFFFKMVSQGLNPLSAHRAGADQPDQEVLAGYDAWCTKNGFDANALAAEHGWI